MRIRLYQTHYHLYNQVASLVAILHAQMCLIELLAIGANGMVTLCPPPSHRTAAGRGVRSVLSLCRTGDGASKHQPPAFPGETL